VCVKLKNYSYANIERNWNSDY